VKTSTPARNYARPACVLVDGPYPTVDREGEEIPEWTVCLGDEEGEVIGKVYRCLDLGTAKELGRKMSRDRRLELVDEATPA